MGVGLGVGVGVGVPDGSGVGVGVAFGTGVGGIGVGGNGEGVGGVPVQTVSRLSILLVAFILDTPGSLNEGIVESPVIIATVPVGEI
jgi:hypothetical protein